MFADLYDNISFNVKLANILGLKTAVYWAELMFISKRVVAKEKFDTNGYFKLDREYVTKYTTLNEDDQQECDAILSEAGIIEIKDQDYLRLDAEKMTVLIAGISDTQLKTIKSRVNLLSRDQRKEARLNGMAQQIKSIVTEFDFNLRNAYYNYIDTIVRIKYFNQPMMKTIMQDLDNYSSDPKVKKIIIELMMAAGYTVAAWGIQIYEKEYKKGGLIITNNVKKKAKIDESQVF